MVGTTRTEKGYMWLEAFFFFSKQMSGLNLLDNETAASNQYILCQMSINTAANRYKIAPALCSFSPQDLEHELSKVKVAACN